VRKTLFDRAVAPLLGLLFIDSLANEEIDPELKELVEDVLLNRRPDATERLVDYGETLKGK
jgi:cobalamin-dependent methionine synthase I